MKKNKVIIILGPTAIGKSDLGIKLAQKYSGEIISGDSMQVYKGLDIGTAKVSKKEQEIIQHYLIDICDVTQRYTVKKFQEQSQEFIEQISSKNKIPIIVGGTGFYLNALVEEMNLGGDKENSIELRNKLLLHDKKWLQEKLSNIDPLAYKTIDINNTRRVIRAIEVFETTGQSIVNQKNNKKNNNEYLLIGLSDNRDHIYDRINKRVDLMFDNGLVKEARKLYDIRDQVPQAKTGIGYKELFGYFDGIYSIEEAKRLVQRNTRRFAKRQLTYFKNQMDVNWFLISEKEYIEKIENTIDNFLKS
ncbi:tRNA (adenosine(37)-N6)-dimethylallyltransferase MiaA [Companilactobacillus sp. DQM5]|uniref:tRNA (adenosine(37)-N6)-dimethylallyltransferase MiaA n=1 Tax=Companilactobacillus sp. DQM5 TaxID=3463359 RepID=UPI004058B3E7